MKNSMIFYVSPFKIDKEVTSNKRGNYNNRSNGRFGRKERSISCADMNPLLLTKKPCMGWQEQCIL